jgi:hypothetical protein
MRFIFLSTFATEDIFFAAIIAELWSNELVVRAPVQFEAEVQRSTFKLPIPRSD